MKNLSLLLFVFILQACSQGSNQTNPSDDPVNYDRIYHYSVLKALDNGVLEGTMKVKDIIPHGDIGLGTFNALDGEMIVLDGEVYRHSADGQIVKPDPEMLIPYTVVSFFRSDEILTMEGDVDYPSLKEFIEGRLPSLNLFYAIRIEGTFEYIKCGGAYRQERPYNKTLPEILEGRPVFESENISGTLVGFWCPNYIGDINSDGIHLHFLADDHSIGGHLLDFRASSIKIQYDDKTEYEFILPNTDEFKEAFFREDEVDY